MRAPITACLLLAATATTGAAGQEAVVVTRRHEETIEGQLLALTPERLTLSRDGRLEQIPLDTVSRVVRPLDGVGDGLLKGFLIGFLPVLLWSRDPGLATRAGFSYGLLGAGIDALHGRTVVLYDRNAPPPPAARPTVGWTIRF